MPTQFSVTGGSVSGTPLQTQVNATAALKLGSLGCCCEGQPCGTCGTVSTALTLKITGSQNLIDYYGTDTFTLNYKRQNPIEGSVWQSDCLRSLNRTGGDFFSLKCLISPVLSWTTHGGVRADDPCPISGNPFVPPLTYVPMPAGLVKCTPFTMSGTGVVRVSSSGYTINGAFGPPVDAFIEIVAPIPTPLPLTFQTSIIGS